MIEYQKNAGGHQHGKSRQTHARSNEPSPGGERQAPQAHSLGAHVQRGRNEVQGSEQLAHTEDGNRRRPENYAGTLSRTSNRSQRAEGGIHGPAAQRGSVS